MKKNKIKKFNEMSEEITYSPVPEVGKVYDYFDNGMINYKQKMSVKIMKVIPFTKIDRETLKLWETESKNLVWLYNKETDYFVKGYLVDNDVEVVFVRSKYGGWYSLGWSSGRLDIDGYLMKCLIRKCNN
jgi:hypothetical protein